MKKANLVLSLFFACTVAFAQSENKNAMRFAKTITAEDAKKHLSVLASDEYEGRETGKEGQRKAAKYIAENFKALGLKSATDNSYLQKVPLMLSTPGEARLEIGGKKYENMKDFFAMPLGNDVEIKGTNILFVGYGITEKGSDDGKSEATKPYNDYNGVDVMGKVVLILSGEPLTKDSISLITGTKKPSKWSSSSRKKISLAKQNGAAALIIISSGFEENLPMMKKYLSSPSLDLIPDSTQAVETEAEIAQIFISESIGSALLSSQKKSIAKIKSKILRDGKSDAFELKSAFLFSVKNSTEKIYSENVLGVVEGSEFKDEVIFVTAHYDHLGVRDGKVFNGADDDGSGTVGVMEIAEAFAQAKAAGLGPKRTIVFMTVTGEEKGLLGSSYYTDNPIFPINKTVCDLNIDMIGRIDEDHKKDSAFVYIIGSDKISTELHAINENANKTYTKLSLDYTYNAPDDPNRFYYRSDHYNFAEKGVPIIFYFNGVHEDYHKETDEISKINFGLLATRAQLVFYTAWEVANRAERIKTDVPQEEK